MSMRKVAFWTGFIVGAATGYVVGVAMPQEQQERLRQRLVTRGEEVITKAREVGGAGARVLTEEARRRAESLREQAQYRLGERVPFVTPRTNGSS